jgi:hypothetical protein
VPIRQDPYSHMKTTIELPEDLFRQAKRHALEQGTTLKALMEAGLRQSLVMPKQNRSKPYQFPVITAMAKPQGRLDLNRFIDDMRAEQSAPLLAEAGKVS